ncbi:gallinacin-9-like [Chelonoidis abingdonii]|uniref:gallinacin-9-like n=1 Tax=Chelonoidis abingdonii TaxID=106734 RepID=UPI003F490AE7
MKILYLLVAIFFLVLQGMPEFSEAQNPFKLCKYRGGSCSYKRCPFNSKVVGICGGRFVCCRR